MVLFETAAICTAIAAIVSALFVWLRSFIDVYRPPVAPNEHSISTVCLGRPFKVGMLYNTCKDSLLTKKMLWNDDTIKKATTTEEEEETCDYEVISNDTLATKVGQLGIETDLSLSVVSGLVDISKSAEYLTDIRTSSRQARVVLKCQRFTKTKKLTMNKRAKFTDPKLLTDGTATHVVVGIKYGSEAFFVFDREVPNDEDYDNALRDMESLVLKVPSFAKKEAKQSEEETLLASKLQYAVHGDQPVLISLSTLNDVIALYKRFLNDSRTEVPKVAWLYPLHLLDKGAPTVSPIEHPLIMKTLTVMDSLHTSAITSSSLSKHHSKVCECFPSIGQQLEQCYTSLEEQEIALKSELGLLLPKIRESDSVDDLKHLIAGLDTISKKSWLDVKKDELEFLSLCLKKLTNAPGIKILIGLEQLEEYKKTNKCIVNLELCFVQKNNTIPIENQWYKCNDSTLPSEISVKIDNFGKYASANKDTLWTVTCSNASDDGEGGILLKIYEPSSHEFKIFEFPSRVGKPIAKKKTWNNAHLKWSVAHSQSTNPIEYIVSCRQKGENMDKKWLTQNVQGHVKETAVNNLKPEKNYEFKVVAKYSFGLGPESDISDTITTHSYPLVIRIQKDKKLSEMLANPSNGPSIYKLKYSVAFYDEEKNIQQCKYGERSLSGKPTKVIMVMGATGAGKSTLINGMVNYILGVKFEDDFRFKLICDESKECQAHSQTNIVTAYTFYWQEGFTFPCNLTIIDTPGFGDTRGLERDKEIPKQIKSLFSLKGDHGVDQIHAIGFVTQAALVRLTQTQRYIFSSILEIFGKDIAGNIFIMATFADNPNPGVIQAVEEADVPHSTFFPFNNSGLYNDPQSKTTRLFWEMGYSSFDDFFSHIRTVDPASLQLTCEVLKERELLQATLSCMQSLIQAGLANMDSLRKEEEMLKQNEAKILANENFEYEARIPKQRKVDLPTGDGACNCIECNITCQYPCKTSDQDMHECHAMDIEGDCQVCPGKCSWKEHHNNPYRFEDYEEIEIKRSQELFERYEEATATKDSLERIIGKLEDDLGDLSEKVYGYVEEVKRCQKRLNEIALRPNTKGEIDYLDVLIETEKQEMKKGYQDRINSYIRLREQAQILAKSASSEDISELEMKSGKKKSWWKFWSK